MGEVYRAYDQSLRRDVAIKHIRADRQASEESRRRLRREARAIAAISHPAIVQIFDLLEIPEGDWIVMELVEGLTVAEMLRRGPLNLAVTLTIGSQVAAGLAFAHDRGFVHRDLKAENIILSPGRGARILDFGLCRQIHADDPESSLTLENAVVGTCRAMSPEQAQGFHADERSDLFSLGILLYECSTRVSPFAASSPVATLTKVCTEQQRPLVERDPSIPPALSILVDKLLEKLPEHRPRSATLVQAQLEAIFEEHEKKDDPGDVSTWAGQQTILNEESPRKLPAEGSDSPPGSTSTLTVLRRVHWAWLALSLLFSLAVGAGVRQHLLSRDSFFGAETSTRDPAAATDLVLQGFELLRFSYRKDHVDRAIENFEQALELDGPDARALAGLCEAFIARFHRDRDPLWLDRAADQAQLAVELESQLARTRYCLGNVLLGQGRLGEALQELDEAILLKPLSADQHTLRGLVLFRLEFEDEARQALERAISIDPNSWFAQDALGYLEIQLGENEAAAKTLSRAAQLAPDNAVIHKNLGVTYFRLERFDEAATQFQKSLEIEPLHSTYTNLGTLEFFRGRYRAALEAFDQAVDNGAHSYLNWANLGDAQRLVPEQREAAAGSYRRAIQLLDTELDRRPQSLNLRSRRALFLAKLGDIEPALLELEDLAIDETVNQRILYRVAQTYEIAGLREQALEALASALDKGFPLTEISRDPELTELRQDARYHRLVSPLQDRF